ncbi:hypothetical protein MT997_25875 [Paenibacillus sp. OVF10]|nr:hypothetical protein MT997_25875 [Paenibacillus sp. OVF10]
MTRGWDVTDAGARTEKNGDTIRYNAELNPGAKFSIQEHMRIYPAMDSSYDPDKGKQEILTFSKNCLMRKASIMNR